MKKQKLVLTFLAALSCCLILAGCGGKKTTETKGELTEHLVGYWKMDDKTSDKIVLDATANGNNGTSIQNTNQIKANGVGGVADGALTFNGSSDCVKVGANVYSDNMSVSLWIKPDTLDDGTWHAIYGYQDGDGNHRTFCLWQTPSNQGVAISFAKSDNRKLYSKSQDSVLTGDWQHIVVVKNGTAVTLYANGIAYFMDASSFTDIYKQNVFYIGKVDNFFKGNIDNVSIFNKALSADEVSFLYNN